MSTTSLTVWSALVAGLSILTLVVLDHRQPARRRTIAPSASGRGPTERIVTQRAPVPYHPSRWWHRLFALVGTAVGTVVLGIISALVVGTAAVAAIWYLSGVAK